MAREPSRMPTYSCYLLQSLHPKGAGRTYVGFTVSPLRRIRQHNGEIKGGALRTARFRPWELVLVVHGFTTKTIALQFEWAWTKPDKSRLLRDAVSQHVKSRGKNRLDSRLVVLALILNTKPFSLQPLGVHLFGCAHQPSHFVVQRHEQLLRGEMHLPAVPEHVRARITSGDASACDALRQHSAARARGAAAESEMDDEEEEEEEEEGEEDDEDEGEVEGEGQDEGSDEEDAIIDMLDRADSGSDVDGAVQDRTGFELRRPATGEAEGRARVAARTAETRAPTARALPCTLCGDALGAHFVGCSCAQLAAHPHCLAARFLGERATLELIPAAGKCPSCEQRLLWPDAVRLGLDAATRTAAPPRTAGAMPPPARATGSAAAGSSAPRARTHPEQPPHAPRASVQGRLAELDLTEEDGAVDLDITADDRLTSEEDDAPLSPASRGASLAADERGHAAEVGTPLPNRSAVESASPRGDAADETPDAGETTEMLPAADDWHWQGPVHSPQTMSPPEASQSPPGSPDVAMMPFEATTTSTFCLSEAPSDDDSGRCAAHAIDLDPSP